MSAGLHSFICDHPACGNVHSRGMTEGQMVAARQKSFRNLPPCPKCGRRLSFRLADTEDLKQARQVSS